VLAAIGALKAPMPPAYGGLGLGTVDPGRTIALPTDNFLSQKVLCLQGKWATRRDGIKYMANVASGIHSGRRKTDVEHLLNRIRHAANYAAVPLPAGIGAPGEMAASFQFNAQALNDDADLPFSYDPKNIDPVLVEMLATGHFLAISPDILTLETNVTKELRG
jgi:hypothetical protein